MYVEWQLFYPTILVIYKYSYGTCLSIHLISYYVHEYFKAKDNSSWSNFVWFVDLDFYEFIAFVS